MTKPPAADDSDTCLTTAGERYDWFTLSLKGVTCGFDGGGGEIIKDLEFFFFLGVVYGVLFPPISPLAAGSENERFVAVL